MALPPELSMSFIVRLHLEPGNRWRGVVEEVRSGQHRAFQGLDEVGAVLRAFVDPARTTPPRPASGNGTH